MIILTDEQIEQLKNTEHGYLLLKRIEFAVDEYLRAEAVANAGRMLAQAMSGGLKMNEAAHNIASWFGAPIDAGG